jgi:hypothetical protein
MGAGIHVQVALENLTGKRFGRLEVIGLSATKANGSVRQWECLCECGKTTLSKTASLKNGHKQSCGCYGLERRMAASRKIRNVHGLSATPEYQSWNGMKNRCLNPNRAVYSRYGGRGITICSRWVKSFKAFLKDMGPRPSAKHSIERIDGNVGYEPSNCRWATKEEQANNRSTNRRVSSEGEEHTVAEWSRKLDIPYSTLWNRQRAGRPLA